MDNSNDRTLSVRGELRRRLLSHSKGQLWGIQLLLIVIPSQELCRYHANRNETSCNPANANQYKRVKRKSRTSHKVPINIVVAWATEASSLAPKLDFRQLRIPIGRHLCILFSVYPFSCQARFGHNCSASYSGLRPTHTTNCLCSAMDALGP